MKQLFIAGDSTAAIKSNTVRPESGWGEFISHYLKEDIQVRNYALNGRSTLSFIQEGHWQKILENSNSGDFVIIQFGHNDSKKEDPTRFADASTDYKDNLGTMIRSAKKHGLHVILASSIARANFENNRWIESSDLDTYATAMKEVSLDNKLTFVDMYSQTKEYFNELGEKATYTHFLIFPINTLFHYPNGIEDHTHLNFIGANRIAEILSQNLTAIDSPLQTYIKEVL